MKKKYYKNNLWIFILGVGILVFGFSVYSYIGRGKKRAFGQVTEISSSMVTITNNRDQPEKFALSPTTKILEKNNNQPALGTGDFVLIEVNKENIVSEIRITPGDRFTNRNKN